MRGINSDYTQDHKARRRKPKAMKSAIKRNSNPARRGESVYPSRKRKTTKKMSDSRFEY